ncbi:MAG: hypothetical protein A2X46_00700 [Lentisphaerae bacterium GWF2_57_35]|nr:MAG: hypothetical protein A2X46_00700 [Lentisphaerae bacterium GWF2_57_35]
MNPWDNLTGVFHDAKAPHKIPAGSADTILLVYPPILDVIDEHFPKAGGLKALDIGCGAGQFCRTLYKRGFEVTGVDPSEGMIEIARQQLPASVQVLHGDIEATPPDCTYDVITAIMVFQFVANIRELFEHIDRRLKPSGLFLFAVFNPDFVRNLLKDQILFKEFDSPEQPVEGFMELVAGVRIPVFIRRTDDYQELLEPKHYAKILEDSPPFTHKFLETYPVPFPTDTPEFLILGFRKEMDDLPAQEL